MATYQLALHIRGFSPANVLDGSPYVFTSGPLDPSSLPTDVFPSGCVTLPLISNDGGAVSGITTQADLRNPERGAGSVIVRLVDDNDILTAAFADDSGLVATQVWDFQNSLLSSTATTFTIVGPNLPEEGRVYWIEQEAVLVTAVIPVSTPFASFSVIEVERGQCGSRARTHRLDPSQYAPNDNGLQDVVSLYDRPQLEAAPFEVALALFRMQGNLVQETVWMRQGFLNGRPNYNSDGTWSLEIVDVTKRLVEHRMVPRKVLGSMCVRFEQSLGFTVLPDGSGGFIIAPQNTLPSNVTFLLTRYEFERLFNEPVHVVGNDSIDFTMVDDLNAIIQGNVFVEYLIRSKIGGHDYLFSVNELGKATYLGVVQFDLVRVEAKLIAASEGASIGDNPISGIALSDPGLLGLNVGWSRGISRVPSLVGEQPEHRLMLRITQTFPQTLRWLAISDRGDGSLGADDVILGRVGCAIQEDLVNVGTAPLTPFGIPETTDELAKLGAVLPTIFQYHFLLKEKMVDWIKNELKLNTCLLGTIPTTGKLAVRIWFRLVDTSTAFPLNTIDAEDRLVAVQRLTPLRGITVSLGIDLMDDFNPTVEGMTIRQKGARGLEALDNGEDLRIWRQVNAGTAQVVSTLLFRVVQAFFRTLQGQPIAIRVPLFIEDNRFITFGDRVSLTEPNISIPTPQGYGVVDRKFISTGMDVDVQKGVLTALLVPDAIDQFENASTGQIAPALEISSIVSVVDNGSHYRVRVQVDSVGEAAFNIVTDHAEIWSDLLGASGYVRIVNVRFNGFVDSPNGPLDRLGWMECYGVVSDVEHLAGSNFIQIDVSKQWEHDSVTIAVLVPVGGYILLTDLRAAATNRENVDIAPIAEQLFNNGDGDDFAKHAPQAPSLPFDNHFTRIGA